MMDGSRPKDYNPERWKRAVAATERWAIKPGETDLAFMQRVRAKWELLPIVRVV